MPLCYQDDVTLARKHLNIGYLQFKLGYALFTIQICICLYAREPDIMGLMDPLLIDTVIHLDKVKLATQEEIDSRYPNYYVLITQ